MKTVKLRKGQTRLLKDGTQTYDVTIKIPHEQLELLGWNYGDELIITGDKRTKKLIAERKEI